MNMNSFDPSNSSISKGRSVSLMGSIAVLYRRKLLLRRVFLSAAGFVLLAVLLVPSLHESRMKILVKNGRADLIVRPGDQVNVSAGDVNEAIVSSEIEILTSNDILREVVRNCHLYGGSSWGQEPNGEGSGAFERVLGRVRRNLSVSQVSKSNVIQVIFTDTNPERGAAVLRALASAYLEAHLRAHRTPGTMEFFHAQALLYEKQLHDAEKGLSEFRRKNDVTSVAQEKDLTLRKAMDSESALREVDATLAETVSRGLTLHREIVGQTPRITTQTRVLPNQLSVERLNTMLAELENRRVEALLKFLPEDRIIAELDTEIKNTRSALERAVESASVEKSTDINPLYSATEQELARVSPLTAGLRSRRNVVFKAMSAYYKRLTQLENVTTDYDTLQREVKEAEENYLLYAHKQEEARIADSLDQEKIANVSIVEQPTAQQLPAEPGTLLSFSIGLLFAGLVGLGAVFMAESYRSTFHTPAELEVGTGLPVLATFPIEAA